MTIKEAILLSLQEIGNLTNYSEVYNHIISHRYYDFKGDTPMATVSAQLGDFIRLGDTRIKRVKKSGAYFYYLTVNEENLQLDDFEQETTDIRREIKVKTKASFDERDLHKLLSSYLKNQNIYSKTIFHESSNGKDNNQIWTHPDMVGIKFLTLQTKASQSFIKTINRVDTFKISSYEIKKEINSDSELKKAFFQAVSNSSWANYGYLVAFEISDNLHDEMERLNQSFGIGVIQLKANPYESKILFTPKLKDLDFKTIDKLSNINPEFEKFVEQIEKLMIADDRYYKATEKELNEFCDDYFRNDTEIEKYCTDKKIPFEAVAE